MGRGWGGGGEEVDGGLTRQMKIETRNIQQRDAHHHHTLQRKETRKVKGSRRREAFDMMSVCVGILCDMII